MESETKAELIHLLVISSQFDLLNKLLSRLRNEGLQLKALGTDSQRELHELLSSRRWDLVIYGLDSALSLNESLKILSESGLELPIIVLTDSRTRIPNRLLLGGQIQDLVGTEDDARLQLAIKREVDHQRLKKRFRLLSVNHRELEKRHQSLLDNTQQALAYILEGMHLYCNRSYAELFAASSAKALEKTPLLDLFSGKQRENLRYLLSGTVNSKQEIDLEFADQRLNLIFTPVSVDGQDCLQLMIRPGTGNVAYSKKRQTARNRDLLTRLYNRTFFLDKVEQAIADALRNDKHAAFILVEVNEFLDIQSTIGLANANLVLRDIAGFLQKSVKKNFSAARLGDFEFGLLVEDCRLPEAIDLANFIKSKINNHVTTTALPSLQLSCSLGIAAINEQARDAEDLIARARLNLNNQTVPGKALAQQNTDSDDDNLDLLTAQLNAALANKRFALLFQPMVSLQNDSSNDYEVLSRMLDEDQQIIPPAKYIPLANLNGMGEALDKVIVALACDALKKAGDIPVRLIINLTNNSLSSLTFLPWLSKYLLKRDIGLDRLLFQISEVTICNSLESCTEFCHGLASLGIAYIVCHYGCVIDPDKYLSAISPKCVKLDNSLVRDISISQYHQEELTTLIQELHGQGFKVIVPHVEDNTVLPLLWKAGADYVQGYSLERPSQNMDYDFVQNHIITLRAPG